MPALRKSRGSIASAETTISEHGWSDRAHLVLAQSMILVSSHRECPSMNRLAVYPENVSELRLCNYPAGFICWTLNISNNIIKY